MLKKLGGIFGRSPTFKDVTVEGMLSFPGGVINSGAALVADTDGTLAANSDTRVATQKATKTYVDGVVTGLLDFKGGINCSASPNYPAGLKGDTYVVSTGGKIGGASGLVVAAGDALVCSADNAGGTQASVGSSWFILEKNLDGALLSANNLSDLANAATARTNLGLGSAATTAATDYAVAAKGVTNGDSHDHNGGDGAQIAYSSLSGLPSLGTIASQAANNVAITGGAISGTSLQGVTPTGATGTGKLVFDSNPVLSGSLTLGVTSSTTGDALSAGGGNNSTYNGLAVMSNTKAIGTQANNTLPSWIVDVGGRAADGSTFPVTTADKFRVARLASGGSYYGAADLLAIDNAGNATLGSGNLVIGTSGKGIDFSATPDSAPTSELLDDYEEGTWAATSQGGANLTGTPTMSQGKYTKIGRQVTLQGVWTINATAGSTQTYVAFTIPYARDEANDRTVGIVTSYSNWRVGIVSTGSPTTTTLYLVIPAASAQPSGTDTFNFSVTYFTTT